MSRLSIGLTRRLAIPLLCGLLCVPVSATQKRSHKPKPKPQAGSAPAAPALPPGPLTPLTLQQTPALPAQVVFQDGQLTITARNSTLSDILRAVHAQTGAAMEFPSNATERVVGQFGPGPACEVLAALLHGSSFNYVLLGSAADPDGLVRVIVTPAASGEPGSNPTTTARSRPNLPGQIATPASNDDADDDNADDVQYEMPSGEQADQEPPRPNGQPVIKTPEQLLQELQRQQQQLQQQQQPPTGMQPGVPSPPDQSAPQDRRDRE